MRNNKNGNQTILLPPQCPPIAFLFPMLIASAFAIQPQMCIANCSSLLKHSLGFILRSQNRPSSAPLPPAFSPMAMINSSPQLLAPLHSVIQSSTNNIVIRRKTEWICLSVDKFKLCSDECDDNRQKMVELANLGLWATICRLLFDNPKIFSDFISCQRKHLEEVIDKCHQTPQQRKTENGQQSSSRGQLSLKQFCKNMREYTKCYTGIRLKCSRNATQVYRQITDSIGQSFVLIRQLSRGHLQIPDDCIGPIADSVNAIVEKGSREEEAEYVEDDTQIVADYWNDGDRHIATENGRRKASNGFKEERSGAKLMFCFISFIHLISFNIYLPRHSIKIIY